jgi:hypothetical protein
MLVCLLTATAAAVAAAVAVAAVAVAVAVALGLIGQATGHHVQWSTGGGPSFVDMGLFAVSTEPLHFFSFKTQS